MLEFRCQHCGQRLTAGGNLAGRDSRCPRCKHRVAIPSVSAPPPSVVGEDQEVTLIDPAVQPHDDALLNLTERHERLAGERAEEAHQEKATLASLGFAAPVEHTGERRYPWPLDVLLYPSSGSGLTMLALLVGVPLVLDLIHRFVPVLGRLGLAFLIARIAFGLYVGYYFAECVYDSAKGGTRAPKVFGGTLDWSEIWSRVSYLLAVYFVYALPAVVCERLGGRGHPVFWALLAYGLVFFPMGLLAMVMLDSISALNPLLLLGSIFRVFLPYCGLMLLFAVVVVPVWLAHRGTPEGLPPLWLEIVGLTISSYGAFLLAHILGRFYWRCNEQLDWGL